MFEAAEIGCYLRAIGLSTADEKSIDIDVILAAQAISLKTSFERIIIVTANPKHIALFKYLGLYTWAWKQALSDCIGGEMNLYESQ